MAKTQFFALKRLSLMEEMNNQGPLGALLAIGLSDIDIIEDPSYPSLEPLGTWDPQEPRILLNFLKMLA